MSDSQALPLVPAVLVVALVLTAVALSAGAGYLLGRRAAEASSGAAAAASAAQRDVLAVENERLRAERDAEADRRSDAERELSAAAAARDSAVAAVAAQREEAAHASAQLLDTFSALSAEALAANNERFLTLAESRLSAATATAAGDLQQRQQSMDALLSPVAESLSRVQGQLRELESARISAYSSLTEQVGFARETSEALRRQTAVLVNALRAPQARGRWGEMQLRRVAEVAGMVEHCDFTEQLSVAGEHGQVRPDMVIHLSGGRNVVVDAKVSLAAYLEAVDAEDEATRAGRLAAHTRHLKNHVDALAAKSYWSALPNCPEFVVLFVPGEAFLVPALEHDPQLLETAARKRVLLATPTTLIALLRTVAFAWQQSTLTDNAREILEVGQQLYGRLTTFGEHLDKLGRSIERSVTDYNGAVGCLDARVLTSARRLAKLGVAETELTAPAPVDIPLRAVATG